MPDGLGELPVDAECAGCGAVHVVVEGEAVCLGQCYGRTDEE